MYLVVSVHLSDLSWLNGLIIWYVRPLIAGGKIRYYQSKVFACVSVIYDGHKTFLLAFRKWFLKNYLRTNRPFGYPIAKPYHTSIKGGTPVYSSWYMVQVDKYFSVTLALFIWSMHRGHPHKHVSFNYKAITGTTHRNNVAHLTLKLCQICYHVLKSDKLWLSTVVLMEFESLKDRLYIVACQTNGQTHRRDRFYTLDHWRKRE